eukprot:240137_1
MAKGCRMLIVTLIAFYELFASGLSSLAMSQGWFESHIRGFFILGLSSSTIVVRILQITFYKCKLNRMVVEKEMTVIKETEYREKDTEIDSYYDPASDITKTEKEASDITNYRFALYFIA